MSGSKQRNLIRDIIKNNTEHLSADEVYNIAVTKMPGIALATVYNNLNALYLNGEIGKVYKNPQADRFDRSPVCHAHLICENCGKVEDLFLENIDSFLEQNINTKIKDYEFNIKILCKDCDSLT